MGNELESFEYFISQRAEVAVVTLVGSIVETTAVKIEEFRRSMESLRSKNVIVNFRDVQVIQGFFVSPFGTMSDHVRKRGQLRISGLRPEFRETLHPVLREHELANNLAEAIKGLMAPVLTKVG